MSFYVGKKSVLRMGGNMFRISIPFFYGLGASIR